jgi:type II secretory pathway component PulM
MKERLQQLTPREKRVVFMGAIVLLLLLLYSAIYAPLTNKIDSLRRQLVKDQQLLVFMRETELTLQHYSAIKERLSGTALLSAIERQLNEMPLKIYPAEFKQTDNNAVELTFKKINFDRLLAWWVSVSKNHHWRILQLHITQTDEAGMVSAVFILTSV